MPELSNAPSSPEINAEELARRFEEKKKLLENTGLKSEARDVFRDVFREHVVPQISQSASVAGATPVASSGDKTELKDLVSLALEKGILEAIAKAQAETPYLIDALHDELADHYYDKLLALGKISADA